MMVLSAGVARAFLVILLIIQCLSIPITNEHLQGTELNWSKGQTKIEDGNMEGTKKSDRDYKIIEQLVVKGPSSDGNGKYANPCNTNPCVTVANCEPNPDGLDYKCKCPDPNEMFVKTTQTCIVNPCTQDDICGKVANCEADPDGLSHECKCPDPKHMFTQDSKSCIGNPCTQGICGNAATCKATSKGPKDYECICPESKDMFNPISKTCIADPCASNICGIVAKCEGTPNGIDGYVCICPNSGDNFDQNSLTCIKVNPCTKNICGDVAICKATPYEPKDFECICPKSNDMFDQNSLTCKDKCGEMFDDCRSKGATCEIINERATCVCPSGLVFSDDVLNSKCQFVQHIYSLVLPVLIEDQEFLLSMAQYVNASGQEEMMYSSALAREGQGVMFVEAQPTEYMGINSDKSVSGRKLKNNLFVALKPHFNDKLIGLNVIILEKSMLDVQLLLKAKMPLTDIKKAFMDTCTGPYCIIPPNILGKKEEFSKIEPKELTDPCEMKPCDNRVGTKCSKNGMSFSCRCRDHFTPVYHSEISGNIFETCTIKGRCNPDYCKDPNSECVDLLNGQTECRCKDGFLFSNSTDHCIVRVRGRCYPDYCKDPNSECVDLLDGQTDCRCKDGFFFSNSTNNCIDVCSGVDCGEGACEITKSKQQYQCKCVDGNVRSYCVHAEAPLSSSSTDVIITGSVLGAALLLVIIISAIYISKQRLRRKASHRKDANELQEYPEQNWNSYNGRR